MADIARSTGKARPYVILEERDCVLRKFDRTRASDASPARARPICSSTAIIFFWYEDSSSALR